MDTLMKELRFTDGIAVVLDAPPEMVSTLEAWEANGASISREMIPGSTYVLAFVEPTRWADHRVAELLAGITPENPVLWLAFRTTKAPADGDWEAMTKRGFRPVLHITIDEHWTAYRYRQHG